MASLKLLFYTPMAHEASYRLEEAVAKVVSDMSTEVVHTAEDLLRRLGRPHNCPEVAVILASSRDELQKLLALEHLLGNLRIILILPDTAPQTISRGHGLRPRYMSNIQSDFKDVAAVLRRLAAGVMSARQPSGATN